ncbi:hypothetical protein AMTR_s00051p00088170 [Amborella trichopoda]|uniref:Uncharacterized protein n=1 Tax=Amborella trichopoda TaxID=13333 RepID=U5D331_AMBTC|nr:hypothetical protein AMTR_s00051p00088170 [Amborella trichopoda]
MRLGEKLPGRGGTTPVANVMMAGEISDMQAAPGEVNCLRALFPQRELEFLERNAELEALKQARVPQTTSEGASNQVSPNQGRGMPLSPAPPTIPLAPRIVSQATAASDWQ